MYRLAGVDLEVLYPKPSDHKSYLKITKVFNDDVIEKFYSIKITLTECGGIVMEYNNDTNSVNVIKTVDVADKGRKVFKCAEELVGDIFDKCGYGTLLTKYRIKYIKEIMVKVIVRNAMVKQLIAGKLDDSFIPKLFKQRVVIEHL